MNSFLSRSAPALAAGVAVLSLISLGSTCFGPDPPVPADCPPGQLPCPEDSTICCEVECPEGYHLGGPDSTDCLLDTTSHRFTWTIDTLGGRFSTLRDVAIISRDDIWVVGDIRMPDTKYNAAHWNGMDWELVRIPVTMTGGAIGFLPLKTVFVFKTDEVYFNAGASLVEWNGSGFKQRAFFWDYPDPDFGSINKMWGSSIEDFYAVGDSGYSVRYNGRSWTKLATGTNYRLHDISGEGEHVFAVGYTKLAESIVLELRDGQWHTLLASESYRGDPENGDYGMATCVDVLADTAYIMAKSGLLKYAYLTGELAYVPKTILNTHYLDITTIRVETPHDIYLLSAGGQYVHYNGVGWHRNDETAHDWAQDGFLYHGADFQDEAAAMVGSIDWVGGFIQKGERAE